VALTSALLKTAAYSAGLPVGATTLSPVAAATACASLAAPACQKHLKDSDFAINGFISAENAAAPAEGIT
jgi:hypothetical protein